MTARWRFARLARAHERRCLCRSRNRYNVWSKRKHRGWLLSFRSCGLRSAAGAKPNRPDIRVHSAHNPHTGSAEAIKFEVTRPAEAAHRYPAI